MSKISQRRRRFAIKRKQKLRKKVKKLKEKYLAAKTEVERNKILEKIRKIKLFYSAEQILKPEK